MPVVQIVSVTTSEVGPSGPVRKLYAVDAPSREAALEAIERKLRSGETAAWIDARHLTLAEGEIRLI